MRIVFMGTPDFAVEALNRINESGHEILAVITQPDKPKGRGKKIRYTPVKQAALDRGLTVLQPEKVKDPEFLKILKSLEPECIVVAAYGQILPGEILELPVYGCINIHASLLPKHRGAAPIHWAVINGEEKTGITIMQMDKGLDTGDMLLKEEVEVGHKTTGELHDDLARKGGELILKALDQIRSGTIEREKQNNDQATYASMIDKKMSRIDWNREPDEIERLIRGLNPWPKAYTMYKGLQMKILEAESSDKKSTQANGTIISASHKGMEISAGGGVLLITKIQFPGKKPVTVDEYLRGNKIETGYILEMEG